MDAPWPSPAPTGLRNHVNNSLMNMGGQCDSGRGLFASPLTATPRAAVKTEGGLNIPGFVRAWTTSPM